MSCDVQQVKLLKDVLEEWKKEVDKKPPEMSVDEAYQTLGLQRGVGGYVTTCDTSCSEGSRPCFHNLISSSSDCWPFYKLLQLVMMSLFAFTLPAEVGGWNTW